MGERVVLLAGLLCTALFLSIALYGELQTWPTFAVDTFRELAIFAFSITIFDNFKDIYLRREIEAVKEKLLDEATGRISTMLNNKNQLASNGIEDALIPFDARALRNIISELSPGDCLYCHDGSIPDFEDLKDLICQRAIDGVRFRFMFLAPLDYPAPSVRPRTGP